MLTFHIGVTASIPSAPIIKAKHGTLHSTICARQALEAADCANKTVSSACTTQTVVSAKLHVVTVQSALSDVPLEEDLDLRARGPTLPIDRRA